MKTTEIKKKVKNQWLEIRKAKINIPRALDYKTYTVALFIDIKKIEQEDQDEKDVINGEKVLLVDMIYKGQATGEVVISDEKDKIYAKARVGSMSQVLRNTIRNCATGSVDLDDFYKDIMSGFIDFCPEMIEYLEKLREKKAKGEL